MYSRFGGTFAQEVGRQAGILALATLALMFFGSCGNNGGGDSQENLSLMRAATARAQARYPDALLVQVLAFPGPEGLVDAGDTERWEFDFMVNDMSAGLVIQRNHDSWSEPTDVGPFFGVIFGDLNRVPLSLGDALARLRAEGFQDAYNEWNLFQPLVPGDPPPYYYFLGGSNPFPGVILRVDAMTGAVEYDTPEG